MMLLRTLVLERDGQDAPVNGALLCGFAVGQIATNFLVYSLDEEVEPGINPAIKYTKSCCVGDTWMPEIRTDSLRA